ncbi:MAG: glycoside hydrolase family 15 protein [Steroidobacteraceae bacterium]
MERGAHELAHGLEQWLEREYRRAAAAMLVSVSPVGIVKTRPGFGHTIRPVEGSIIASPVLADWNPEPDYFFHWFRDSAVVIDAVRLLFEAGELGPQALQHFADFVRFSLSLQGLDGRKVIATLAWRENVAADFIRFLRRDDELETVHGEAIIAETRVNPDGTLDISSWTRPQHDGAPLRALAVLRWARSHSFDSDLSALVSRLVQSDLAFTFAHWREPSFDIWEEENGLHYYTLCVSAAALREGAGWLDGIGESALARSYRAEADSIHRMLDDYWLPAHGHYRSRVLASGARSLKELDIAVILAAIHALDDGPTHSVRDPRMQATLQRLESLFDAAYAINQNRPAHQAPAMGRYAGDVYFSGGAYYFSTLGAAEFCFLAASPSKEAAAWIARGDAFLQTVRAYTPENGELSEQFDQHTGAQTSARHLAWSYAAFISCVAARRAVAGPGARQQTLRSAQAR